MPGDGTGLRGATLGLRVSDSYLGWTWITGEEGGDMKGSKFILDLSSLPFTVAIRPTILELQ